MSIDCDSDTLLITVDTNNPFFHTGNTSCFSIQTSIKGNLINLMEHISQSSKSPSNYTNLMIKYPGLALMKTMEEFWEVITSDYLGSTDHINNHKLSECCDFLSHFFMYLTSRNVKMEDIFNELNARRWNPKLIKPTPFHPPDIYVIGITGNKYSNKTDNFIENKLGNTNGRNMRINYQIINKDKMIEAGIPGDRELSFLGVRPKDIPLLISTNKISAAVTYNTVMDNFPQVSKLVVSSPDPDLCLALIKRQSDDVDINNSGKILIAAEHPVHVEQFLYNKFNLTNKFSLDRIIGSSETFLINSALRKYTLCDAVIESGRTLKENGLEIWSKILDYGEVTIGFYTHY